MTAFDNIGEGTVTHVVEYGPHDHVFFNGAEPVAWITVQDRPEQPEPAPPGDPLLIDPNTPMAGRRRDLEGQ